MCLSHLEPGKYRIEFVKNQRETYSDITLDVTTEDINLIQKIKESNEHSSDDLDVV